MSNCGTPEIPSQHQGMLMGDSAFYVAILGLTAILLSASLAFARWKPTGNRQRRLWRLLAGNLLLLCSLLSTIFTAFETYYRFFYDSTDSFGLSKVMDRWMERHYQTNDWGIRDNIDYAFRRNEASSQRITFLGDSFTAGHGIAEVDDRFVNLVRSARPEWEIQSLAMDGLDTGREIKSLQQLLEKRYELDVVVLVYCLNDISDLIDEWNETLPLIKESKRKQGFLLRNSYAISTLYFRYKVLNNPSAADYFKFVLDHYEGSTWETQRSRLLILQRIIESNGGRLLVVTFPFLHSLGPEYPFRGVHKKLGALWQDLQIPHLDLLTIFDSSDPDEVVLNRYDAHPNQAAHRQAAREIVAFLEVELSGE
jgi:lysophospholipase L1-like esterase